MPLRPLRWMIGAVAIAFASCAQAQNAPTPVAPADVLPRIVAPGPTPSRKTPTARVDTALVTLAEEHRRFRSRRPQVTERFRSAVPRIRLSPDDYVLIDATAADTTATLRTALTALGLRQASQRGRVVSGWIPIAALDRLETIPSLRAVRPVYVTTFAGIATTQGDTAMYVADARAAHNLNGAGVVVGVLSDSYNCLGGASSDVGTGDLPAGVTVLADLSAGACSSATDEGRAMLQIAHDLAPGAVLAFHTAYNGTADFANGILALKQAANARVIVDDVLYFAEPMFQDGIIAQAVDTVVQQGVAYFSAAGNLGAQSYESEYRGSGAFGPSPPIGAGGERHDFDAGAAVDGLLDVTIPAGQTAIVVLQWNQPFFSVSGAPGASTDLDLVLYNSAGTALRAIAAADNIGGDAVEVLGYQNPGPATNFKLAIERIAGPAPTLMKFVWSGPLTLQQFATNSSTLYGHSNAAGARAVGASYYLNTPAFGVSPAVVNSYSAMGGTQILFNADGAPQIASRYKPELVAADGGDTTFFGTDTNSNGYPNFFGTSAAAPHTAGIAALLIQASPQNTPAQTYQALLETTQDMGQLGFDFRTGVGFIRANAALDRQASIDNAALIGFSSTPNGIPTLGSVALNAYQSQGVALQVSDRGDGYANLSAPPGSSSIAEMTGASLVSSGTPGNAWIAMQFATPVTQVSFSFATASGEIQVEIYDSAAQPLGVVNLSGVTAINFAGAMRLGGVATLPNVGPIGRIVVRTLGVDTDVRIDGIRYAAANGTAYGADADAPMLPAWGIVLLGASLIFAARSAPRLRPA